MMSRRFAALTWVVLALAALPSQAQDYPTRAVRLISPNPPGGANDTVARIVADKLTVLLGQRFIIDNRGGAGGIIGGEIAAAASPDGYTLLAGSVSTHSFAPIIQPALKYDPIKDFAPVSVFAIVQNVLVVTPSLAASSITELVAHAKANSGKLNYASGGPGSTSHFAVAMFAATAGIAKDTLHIPHKGGAPALQAVMSGDAHFYFGPIPGMVPVIKSGRVRAIAVSGPQRTASLPELATAAEGGLPGYQSSGWFGLLAPAGTPAAIVAKLSQAVAEAVKADDVVRGFALQGIEPSSNTPEVFATFIRDEMELYRRLAREHELKLE
jgi:tripartite-type tricarboxylate transporter receptor subunit TctC